MRRTGGAAILALALVVACGGGSGGDDRLDGFVMPEPGPADPGVPDTGSDAARDESPANDVPQPSDPGPTDPGKPDAGPGIIDAAQPDPGPSNPDAQIGDKCLKPEECPAGGKCVTTLKTPTYGFCSQECFNDADCPEEANGLPVTCANSLCVLACADGFPCPEGLSCFEQKWCLETPNKGPGGSCAGDNDCTAGKCIEGEVTKPYCAPLCETDADCDAAAPGTNGTCTAVGGAAFKFCLFMCGMYGGECPGDMVCEAVVCR